MGNLEPQCHRSVTSRKQLQEHCLSWVEARSSSDLSPVFLPYFLSSFLCLLFLVGFVHAYPFSLPLGHCFTAVVGIHLSINICLLSIVLDIGVTKVRNLTLSVIL